MHAPRGWQQGTPGATASTGDARRPLRLSRGFGHEPGRVRDGLR